MLKVWGRISSINVQKVVWALDELGLAYERIEAGGAFGVVGTAAFQALNPNRLVPVLEDDGFVLWESNAIVRYLAAGQPAAGLWPADPRDRADADRWMDWQATTATPAMRDAFWNLIRTEPARRDETAITRSVESSARVARILDDALAGRDYLVGDRFTVADLACAAHANRWLKLPIKRPSLPALEAWYERLGGRAGARQVMAVPLT